MAMMVMMAGDGDDGDNEDDGDDGDDEAAAVIRAGQLPRATRDARVFDPAGDA